MKKYNVKVMIYNEEKYCGTLNGAIAFAEKANKKAGQNISIVEIWDAEEDYYLSTIPEFWN